MSSVIHLAGCVVLNKKGRILLLHRNTPRRIQWELPGGKVEEGENEDEAATREIFEELGIKIEIKELIDRAAFDENDAKYSYTWFLSEIRSGSPAILEKHLFDDVDYKDVFEMKDEELSPNVRNLKKNHKFRRIIGGIRI